MLKLIKLKIKNLFFLEFSNLEAALSLYVDTSVRYYMTTDL